MQVACWSGELRLRSMALVFRNNSREGLSLYLVVVGEASLLYAPCV